MRKYFTTSLRQHGAQQGDRKVYVLTERETASATYSYRLVEELPGHLEEDFVELHSRA
jgi:hypothetical protein